MVGVADLGLGLRQVRRKMLEIPRASDHDGPYDDEGTALFRVEHDRL